MNEIPDNADIKGTDLNEIKSEDTIMSMLSEFNEFGGGGIVVAGHGPDFIENRAEVSYARLTIPKINIFDEIGSGGVVCSPEALVLFLGNTSPVGGSVVNGSVTISGTMEVSPNGGVVGASTLPAFVPSLYFGPFFPSSAHIHILVSL
jgi:hypothetical protein